MFWEAGQRARVFFFIFFCEESSRPYTKRGLWYAYMYGVLFLRAATVMPSTKGVFFSCLKLSPPSWKSTWKSYSHK